MADTISIDAAIGGTRFQAVISIDPNVTVEVEETLSAGIAGTLTTRTDDDTGVITLAEGHGITDSDTVDIYFTDGMVTGMTVSSYDSTTITVDAGSGDAFPVEDSAVVVGVQQDINVPDITGASAIAILATGDKRCAFDMQTSVPASVLAKEIPSGPGCYLWESTLGTNPITGSTIANIKASSGETDECAFKLVVPLSV